jgi:hypothetical protein
MGQRWQALSALLIGLGGLLAALVGTGAFPQATMLLHWTLREVAEQVAHLRQEVQRLSR